MIRLLSSRLRSLSSVLACVSLLSSLSFGAALQEEPGDGRATKTEEATFPSGALRERFALVEASPGAWIRHGTYEAWYEDGTVHILGNYEEGRRAGRWEYKHPNGKRASQGRYAKDLATGKWKHFHDNGKKASEGRYVNGAYDGKWRFWDADGRADPERSGTYKSVTVKDSDGVVRARGARRDGLRVGPWTVYWPGGDVQFEGEYRGGRRHGSWFFFHRDGTFDPQFVSGEYWNGRRLEPAAIGPAGYSPPAPRTSLDDIPPAPKGLDPEREKALGALLDAGGHDNLEKLAATGPDALALVLDRLRTVDLADGGSTELLRKLDGALWHLCRGRSFRFDLSGTPAAQAANRLTVLRWSSLASLLDGNHDFWSLDLALSKLPADGATAAPDLLLSPPLLERGQESDVLPIGLPEVYRERFAKRDRGPSHDAIESALAFLARTQTAAGGWTSRGYADDEVFQVGALAVHDVGVTGLALLAFLAEGNTPSRGPYQDAVLRGVRYLCQELAETGLYGVPKAHDFGYDQAIATYALCEALAVSHSTVLRAKAQVAIDWILKARNPYGAWRYNVPPVGDNDTSISSWYLFALKAADWVGLVVDQAAYDGALAWVDEVTDPANGRVGYDSIGSLSARAQSNSDWPHESGEAMTGAGLMMRFLIAPPAADNPGLKKGLDLIFKKAPRWDDSGKMVDMYYWFQAAQALHQAEDPRQRAWFAELEKNLVDRQRRDGDLGGSWDPAGPWGQFGGRIYSTAICALSLQARYRLARLRP